MEDKTTTPKAFICHSSKDNGLSEQIARDLRAKGIDAWWDGWEIREGDSLRIKIDEGIERCDLFIAVITPDSLGRAWVQHELDSGMIKRIEGTCRMIPILHGVGVSELPVSLRSIRCLPIKDYSNDIKTLISTCHGLTDKPPLGSAPPNNGVPTVNLTPAASSVARFLCERSECGIPDDPLITMDDIRNELNLSQEDSEDALYELKQLHLVKIHKFINDPPLISPNLGLFWLIDEYVKGWNIQNDALALATLLANQPEEIVDLNTLQTLLGWEARRLNPAATFLAFNKICDFQKALGTYPLVYAYLRKTPGTRLFVKRNL